MREAAVATHGRGRRRAGRLAALVLVLAAPLAMVGTGTAPSGAASVGAVKWQTFRLYFVTDSSCNVNFGDFDKVTKMDGSCNGDYSSVEALPPFSGQAGTVRMGKDGGNIYMSFLVPGSELNGWVPKASSDAFTVYDAKVPWASAVETPTPPTAAPGQQGGPLRLDVEARGLFHTSYELSGWLRITNGDPDYQGLGLGLDAHRGSGGPTAGCTAAFLTGDQGECRGLSLGVDGTPPPFPGAAGTISWTKEGDRYRVRFEVPGGLAEGVTEGPYLRIVAGHTDAWSSFASGIDPDAPPGTEGGPAVLYSECNADGCGIVIAGDVIATARGTGLGAPTPTSPSTSTSTTRPTQGGGTATPVAVAPRFTG